MDDENFLSNYMSKRNKEEQEQLDEATKLRNSNLNTYMNKALDPGKKEEPQESETAPKKLSLNKLKRFIAQPGEQEDVVPYDENSGTLTNIGRFALNNLMTDEFSGGMPAVGSIKAIKAAAPVAESAATAALKQGGISIPLIEELMGKAPRAASSAAELRDASRGMKAAEAAKTQTEMGKATGDISRALYLQENAAAARAAKLKKLKEMVGG